jgi:uncharacterized protein (TIGR02265 family)
MDARCFYGRLVNGILDVAGPRLDGAAKAALAARGLDPDARLEVYPAQLFFDTVELLATALAPSSPIAEAEHLLGRTVIEGYLASASGRVMSRYFKQLGTLRTLLDAQTFFRTGDNFLQSRATVLEDRKVRLRLVGTCGHPHLYRGIIEAAYADAGEPGLRATLVESGPDDAAFDVTW